MGKKKKKKPSTLTKQKWHIWFISLNFALFPSNKIYQLSQFSSVQFSSVTQSCLTLCDPWMAARQASLSITNSRSTLRLTSIESVMPSTISDSVVHFSSCPQSLPSSESFPVSQLFAWGGQSIGVSALASVLPMNTQDWSFKYTYQLYWQWLCILALY